MAQRLPVQRINTGPQALRYRQRKLKLPSYATAIPPAASLTETFDSVTYQATGAGISHQAAPSGSWTDFIPTTTNCAVVWMSAMPGSNVSATVTIGGINAPAVSGNPFIYDATSGYNELQCFVLMNPPTGTQTVTVTFSGTNYFHATSVYYSGVGAVGNPTFVTGAAGTQPSQTVTSTLGKFYAQAFAFRPADGNSTFTTYTPGGMLALFGNPSNGYSQPLVVGDALGAGADITFSATRNNTSYPWGGVVIPLTCAPIPTRWTNWGTATTVGGMLSCIPSTNYDGGIGSVQAYDLTGDNVAIQLVQPPNVGNGGTMCSLELGPVQSGTNPALHAWSWSNGQLAASNQSGWLWWTTYDPYNHAFLRIREAGGTVYYETSPDGSSWVTQTTTPATFSMSSTYVRIYSGYGGTEPDPGVALWDNLNLAPSVTTYNPTRAAGRNAGPLALRQIIRHRPQPSSPPSVSPSAKIATFTETFDTLDPTVWATVSGTPSSTYGQLTLPCASTYSTVQSVASFDLTDSSVYVNLTQVQAAGNGTTDTIFGVTSNNGQYVWFQVANSQLITLDTTTGSTTTRPYDPIAHQFLRIRANGSGTMWWESSPDASTWIQVATSTGSGLSVGNAQVYFSCGYDGVEDNPLPAMFTDLNLPPSLPTRTAVIPVSRKTGPMALRRRIMRRQQPVYPTLANGYIIDASLTVTAAPGASILPIGNARYADPGLTITASTTATMAVNAVTWESTGAGGSANGGTITWTHTIGATANCVIVGVNTNTNPYNLPTVKVGSSTYLKCLGINYFDSPGGNNNYSMIFGLMNPPTGTQTFTVTGQSGFTSANSVSYNNVSGFDTPVYSNGSGTTMTLTDPGVDAGMVVSVFTSRGPSVLTNYSQWTRHNFRDGNTYPLLIGDAPGGIGLTFSATNSDTSNWGGIGLSLLPQSAAPTGIVYDGMGTSSSLTGYASISFSHVATANAFIILDICADRDNTLTNVQYAGQNMTLQGSVRFPGYSGNAGVWRYTLANAPSGLSTVTATLSANSYFPAQPIGYTGVSSAAAPTTTFGTSSAPSQSVTCNPGQLIVQSIGSASATKIGIPTGGTNLIAANWSGESLVINQATASTTFAGSTSLSNWGAIASVLSRLSFTADSVLAITASPLAVGSVGQFANTTQAITATPTGIGVRNAMVDSTLAVTASRTSNVTWALAANVAQTITASPTSIGSYGAVAAVAQTITANRPANVTWQLKANVTQPITTTITADSLRTAQVNATLPVTASPTSNVTWVLAANVAQTITATLQASELRLVNVDAAMPVTVGRLGTGNVAYDSTGVGATNSAAGGFTLSWNHTIGATANYVVMAISHLTNGASTYTAKCGGVTMTLLGITLNYQTSPGPHSTYVYGLANPPTGTQSMTFQTSANYNYVAGNSVAYSGVGSVAGVFTQSLVGNASFSQTVPSLSNQMLFNAWASDGLARTTAPSYSQTQRSWLPEVDNINPLLFIGDAAGTGSPVTFSGTANASGNWGGVTIALSPLGPTAVTGIRGDVTEAITATLTTTYLRNAIVNATQQIIADRTGAIVVDLHGNATLPVTTTATGAGVRNAMVDSTIAVTASRTANSNWYAYADATQTITPRGLGLETVSPPTWVGTGPGKAQGTSPLTFTDSIPVGTTYTLLFGQLLCASATLPTITTTIGGQSATLVDSVYASPTGGNYLYGFCFALANPPTGSQTVTFTSTENGWANSAVNTVHYSGVGSLGPVSKIGQQAGQPSFSVGTDAKYGYAQAFLYAAAAAGNGFSSYNQNQRWTASRWGRPLLIGDATGNGGTLTFSATRDNTTNGWGAIVVPLAPVSAGAIYGATAATALPITATRLANVTWAAKAAALQQVTASPAAEYSRGQPVGLNVVASATQSITAIPDSTGSRGQTVESTETITVSTDAIGSRGQDIDSPLVVTADLLSMVTWQGWFDAAQVITASDTANAIWALRANAAQQITASYTALASYGATGNALLPITASPLLSNVIWDAQALSDLIVTASTPTIGSRWQPIDSTQAITALLSGIGSRGQFVDSTLGLTIAALPAAISYGATGNAPLVITVNLLTSDTLLDNHAYAALVVNAGRPTSVIWDTRADSRLTVTTHFWATFGRLLNVDANLTVVTRLTAALRAVFLSNASLGIVAGLPTKLSRWQPIDSTQAITATPAGGIVWHGRIGAPLRITATPLGNAIWDAHANSQMTVTESGLIVVSRGQDIDPALDITADTSGEFTQTMSGDVEQAILALPDTELSLGSTMDSALSLIVTYSADIGEALRGGNFFYFYL